MTKIPDYLRRYADRYRLTRREDGIRYILTRFPDRNGVTYDVYDYSDTHLAACLPPQAGRHLLKQFPGVFTVHQDAGDGIVLLFEEGRLHELAEALRLRRKKQISKAERQRLAALSHEHSAKGLRRLSELKRALSEDEQTAPEPAISAKGD